MAGVGPAARSNGVGFTDMAKVYMILAAVILIALIGGFGYLAAFDIPAPRKTFEIVIPNDRLPR